MKNNIIKSTTIIGIRKNKSVVIAGDGQVSMGNTIIKANVKKVRRLGSNNSVITGFAGSTADAFALFERLESKLDQYKDQLKRACVELAKDWRTDRYLRRLEAMMIVADKHISLLLSGTGDVIETDDGILAIGSGGQYANSAAKAPHRSRRIPGRRRHRCQRGRQMLHPQPTGGSCRVLRSPRLG